MTPLRQRMLEDMKLRNYSPKTIGLYVAHLAKFADFAGKGLNRVTREEVRDYLVYTHRVAIANQRLVSFRDDQVMFRWKDYSCGQAQKMMTVSAGEFLRRFLLHVLPSGFVRIRHYGFMANRQRQEKLARCRALLGAIGNDDSVTA